MSNPEEIAADLSPDLARQVHLAALNLATSLHAASSAQIEELCALRLAQEWHSLEMGGCCRRGTTRVGDKLTDLGREVAAALEMQS